jgi:hypothetical protein
MFDQSGLFSAVSTSFIVAMESNLSPDPSETTNALLTQLVQIGLGNFVEAGSTPVAPASTWSLPASTLWIQMIAYASLSMSLLAAFGAVLGKQWLGYYKSNRYGRGSQEERGKRRQEKFDGLVTWYFDAVVQSFPVLLQISLLLFGIALGAKIWSEQASIAWVIIATTVFGFLFYSLTVMACLISPACPFQTPVSTILRMLRIDGEIILLSWDGDFKFESTSQGFYTWCLKESPVISSSSQRQRTVSYVSSVCTGFDCFISGLLQQLLGIAGSRWTRLSEVFRGGVLIYFYNDTLCSCQSPGPVHAVSTFAQQSLQQLFTTLHTWLRSIIPHFSSKVVDSEAQSLDLSSDVSSENEYTLTLLDISTSNLEAPSIKWLFETSTDPEVFLAAASLVPLVEWPLDLDVSDMLHQLCDIFTSCVGFHGQIVPSLEEKASTCIMAISHLYCGRVLQAHPGRGEFLGRGKRDYNMFMKVTEMDIGTVNEIVLAPAMQLCSPEDDDEEVPWYISRLDECPDSVLEWLSHSLPYLFVTGRINQETEEFAVELISKLLSSSSSPSTQIIANCALLACVMVGVQVDKKDIVRIDKRCH